jgi:hypothetical protein
MAAPSRRGLAVQLPAEAGALTPEPVRWGRTMFQEGANGEEWAMRNRGWLHAVLGVLLALCWVGREAMAAEPSPPPATVLGAIAALDDPDNAVAANAFAFLLDMDVRLPPGVQLDEQSLARLRAFWRGPRLEAMLQDPVKAVRLTAAQGISKVSSINGKADKRFPPLLAALLKDPDYLVPISVGKKGPYLMG